MPDSTSKAIDTALREIAQDGELPIRINGQCMHPLIEHNARVTVHKQAFYWPGDVIIKRGFDGKLIAHRLIGFFPRQGKIVFVCCADNSDFADAAVPGPQIIGRVSGGECSKFVVSVPVVRRIAAVRKFTWLNLKRLWRRSKSFLR
jgi:hypothetical protein